MQLHVFDALFRIEVLCYITQNRCPDLVSFRSKVSSAAVRNCQPRTFELMIFYQIIHWITKYIWKIAKILLLLILLDTFVVLILDTYIILDKYLV